MSDPDTSSEPRCDLVGLDRAGLAEEMAGFGAEPFRARQLWHWIYYRGATDFGAMTNLAKGFRERLAARYALGRPEVTSALASSDGTRKWLLRFADGQEVETVHIPEADRGTLCVSSQVGCTLNCTFCRTGTQRLVRNLGAAEIVGQIMVARDALGEWPSPPTDRQLTNIVLMGMGEPLYNYDNVAAALKIVMDPEGLAVSAAQDHPLDRWRRADDGPNRAELGVNLAGRCMPFTDELRDQLVPLNRKYRLASCSTSAAAIPGRAMPGASPSNT